MIAMACPSLYDASLTLGLARESVKVDSGKYNQESLGLAAYRAKHYEEARDALLEAEKQAITADADRFFYLAMALEKLGDRANARRWYDRAVARMDETYPLEPVLRAIRREADEGLGDAS